MDMIQFSNQIILQDSFVNSLTQLYVIVHIRVISPFFLNPCLTCSFTNMSDLLRLFKKIKHQRFFSLVVVLYISLLLNDKSFLFWNSFTSYCCYMDTSPFNFCSKNLVASLYWPKTQTRLGGIKQFIKNGETTSYHHF